MRSKPSTAVALGKYVRLGTRKILRTQEIWKFLRRNCELFFRLGVNRPTFRVQTHRVALHAEQDMSKRPAPPTAAAGAADAGAADDRPSRNPDGAIQYCGGRFDCHMCTYESPNAKKKKAKHSGIGRCRLKLARVARAIQIAEPAAAPAAAVTAAALQPLPTAPPRRRRILAYDRSLARWVEEVGGLVEERIPELVAIARDGTHGD